MGGRAHVRAVVGRLPAFPKGRGLVLSAAGPRIFLLLLVVGGHSLGCRGLVLGDAGPHVLVNPSEPCLVMKSPARTLTLWWGLKAQGLQWGLP